MAQWYTESLYPELARRLRIEAVIFHGETENHEMIAHVPLLGHGAAKRVLIVGGGRSLRRRLMHDVAKVTVVEIDRAAVDCRRRHLAAIGAGAFDLPPFIADIARTG